MYLIQLHFKLEVSRLAYIAYSTQKKNGAIYATLAESVRSGNHVRQRKIENLGRVIDKEQGIFQNRVRGKFKYTLADGFQALEPEIIDTYSKCQDEEKLNLAFGDAYVLDKYMRSLPFYDAYQNLMESDSDTLFSLLLFKMIETKKAYQYAKTWWSNSYACQLFPNAKIEGQRISEFLEKLGSEASQRRFFNAYLPSLYDESNTMPSVLIDSTGLQNASKMQLTQLCNHNGEAHTEIRLIYVCDRENGQPLYFRYNPGNIVDVTTLRTTIAELNQYAISVKYAIVDSGYFSEKNILQLYENEIPFLTRIGTNRLIYKNALQEGLPGLLSSKYSVEYGKRLVYLKKLETDVYGNKGYVYLGIDFDSRNEKFKQNLFRLKEDKEDFEQIDREMAKLGAFVLLSSESMECKDVLPLYYTRQKIEQIFDVGKNNADLLPLRTHKEETFCGHIMLTFMATIILHMLQRELILKRKKTDKINPEGAIYELKQQRCKVFEKNIIPQEAARAANEVYRILGIEYPITIPKSM